MRKKRIAAVILSFLIFGVCLSGCSESGEQAAASAYTTEGKKTELVPDETVTGELVVSKFAEDYGVKYNADLGDQLTAAANRFKKLYPNVKLTVERGFGDDNDFEGSYNKYYTNLAADVMAGKGPDVFFAGGAMDVNKLMRNGVFADLHPYFEKDTSFNIDDYNKAVFTGSQPGGKQYVVPLSYSTNMFLSTKKALESNGFDVSKCADFSSTIDQLETLFQKLGGDVKIENLLLNSELLKSLPDGIGINWMNYDDKTIDLTSQDLKKGCEFAKKYYSEEVISGWFYTTDTDAAVNGWKNNTHVLAEYGSNCFDDLIFGSRRIQEAGEAPVVFGWRDTNKKTTANIVESVAVRNNSKNIENAYRFIKILISPEVQSLETYNSLPVPICTAAVKTIFEWHKEERRIGFSGDVGVLTLPGLTDEFINSYLAICNDISTVQYSSVQVSNFSKNYMKPFYEGTKSYEECLEKAKKYYEIYVSE